MLPEAKLEQLERRLRFFIDETFLHTERDLARDALAAIQSLQARVAELGQRKPAKPSTLRPDTIPLLLDSLHRDGRFTDATYVERIVDELTRLQARVVELEQRKPAALVIRDGDPCNSFDAFEDFEDAGQFAIQFADNESMEWLRVENWTWHPSPERGKTT